MFITLLFVGAIQISAGVFKLGKFVRLNRKFNEVYTKLFNGGNAKLELVDSDDPLEAGLEMLVSPPGKRLQPFSLKAEAQIKS